MRYLPFARNHILPRRVQTVLLIVSSGLMAGFVKSDRLATLKCVTRLKWQLTQAFYLNLMQFVSLLHLRLTSTRTTNLIAWFFHPCRYLIYIYARFVAYQICADFGRGFARIFDLKGKQNLVDFKSAFFENPSISPFQGSGSWLCKPVL
jgi:hypothetical protein